MNFYRQQSGLSPVMDHVAWKAGILQHLDYLANTAPDLRTGEYANDHTENPASSWYSPEGDEAGRSSNLGFAHDELSAIEGWMASPFHAIGLLRPSLTRSAFALTDGRVGLDVIRGLEFESLETDVPEVLFPGDGSVNFIDRFLGELPDPTEGCGPGFTGLPFFAMLPEPPMTGTTASVRLPSGVTLQEGSDLCIVTADSLQSSDSIYGATGAAILRDEDAVLVIPRHPLEAGRHEITINQPGGDQTAWSFTQVISFVDVARGAYYLTAVRWLSANAITTGVDAERFAPSDPVTRAQMALFLYRMAGLPPVSGPPAFIDVQSTDYFADAVRWLTDEGITTGVDAERFAPSDPVTRAQMALFLYRFDGR